MLDVNTKTQNVANNVFYKNIDPRNVTIKLTDGNLLKGKINLLAESPQEYGLIDKNDINMGQFYQRISDIFTVGKNPFIVVFDAAAEWNDSRVFIINKGNILWVTPED
jgi:hypothetical protein